MDIATSIVKENANIMADLLSSSYNDAIMNCNFPSCLKSANVTPILKKDLRMEYITFIH